MAILDKKNAEKEGKCPFKNNGLKSYFFETT